LAALLLLLLMIAAGWRTIDTSSVLMHLKAGEQIVAMRSVPKSDVFSAASDPQGWTYIEWAWAALLATVYGAAKWDGLSWLNVGFIAVTAALLVWRARRRGARWFETLATSAFCLAALLPGFQPEPVRCALVLFMLALLIGESRRLWPLVFLPVVAFAWANTHPAFLLAALVPFARLAFPPRDQNGKEAAGPSGYLFVIIITCVAAALVNPYSIQIARATFETLIYSATETLRDPWQTIGAGGLILRIIAVAVLGATVALARQTTQPWEVVAAAILLAGTIISPASLIFLLIHLAAPSAVALTHLLADTWSTRIVRQAAGVTFLLAIIALTCGNMALGRITSDAFGVGLRRGVFPETAAGRLAALPLRNAILNDVEDGGYLAWRVWPSWKITMDQRPTLYTREARDQYDLLWQGGQGWEEMLNLWRVNAVLGRPETMLEHPENNLFARLAESPDWKPVFWDSTSILYVREEMNLEKTNLQVFRQLKPGLTWAATESRMKSPEQWRELMADLRRATMEDPDNLLAQEYLQLAESRQAAAASAQ
jgi:hypothetical protein